MASNNDEVILLDGGTGHELKLRGISDGSFVAGVLANEKSLSKTNNSETYGPDIVESIHYDFLSAGCDVITTNSFVAVPQRMLECGLASDDAGANHKAAKLIRASVDRARAAIARYEQEKKATVEGEGRRNVPKIAGCVPPLTECYFAQKVPTATSDLVPGYEVILATLLDCNVDVLLAETLSTSREALAILQALSNVFDLKKHHQLPSLWISFTVHDDKLAVLRSDESLEDACQTIVEESRSRNIPLKAIGVNCSAPSAISKAVPIAAKTAEGSGIKICAYGNCFQTTTTEWIRSLDKNTADGEHLDLDSTELIAREEDYDGEGYLLPSAYARYAKEWREKGATIIGGCCACRPGHMREVVRHLNMEV